MVHVRLYGKFETQKDVSLQQKLLRAGCICVKIWISTLEEMRRHVIAG